MSRLRVLCLFALTACLLATSARADLIFMKDGFVLQGNIRREGTSEYDKGSREFIWIPNGFFYVDEGPRRIYFSPTQVSIADRLTAPAEERMVRRDPLYLVGLKQMPSIEDVYPAKDFSPKTWDRQFAFRTAKSAQITVRQRIAEITPYYARADAMEKFGWSAAYLTRELGPDLVHELLRHLPELQDDFMPKLPPPRAPERIGPPVEANSDDKGINGDFVKPTVKGAEKVEPRKPTPGMIVARRLRICDFFAQAGWLDLADSELTRLLADFPDETKRVEAARETVGKLRARAEWEEIKNWFHAGRHDAVRKRIESYNNLNADDRIRSDMREMKAKLAVEKEQLAEAAKALDECVKGVTNAPGRSLASAVTLIKKEITGLSVGRLDAFLGQVREMERQKERKMKPTSTPDQLLALAVSGWLLGSPSAEARPEFAVNLWKTRQLVLEYCQETDAVSRQKILTRYETEVTPRVDLDEVAQLIGSLPPVEPGEVPSEVAERSVGKGKGATKYHLKLPPEYTHTRSYPVLIVLHNSGEKATTMLERWEKAAADHGYILAAPEWGGGFNARYGFSEREHDAVIDTIKDLRKCYQIDSDRVFLFGLGEGGKMALDVGLSKPDMFAGIIPMNGSAKLFSRRYWRNAQYLSVYSVTGSKAGEANEGVKDQFNNWLERGFNALWIEYKGRGPEWFGGEVPNIFDWMRCQKRVFPLRQLGSDGNRGPFGTEFYSMRHDDNRFYWLSTTDIDPRCINSPSNYTSLRDPAQLSARILPESNGIYVKAFGVKNVTIWLGRSPQGQMQIDFDKEVEISLGIQSPYKRKVTPSLGVMLEDLARRGDRKHLYLARIDLKIR